MLVFAYAPWCPHCVQFKPIWDQFQQQYGGVLDMRVVNSDLEPDLIEKIRVDGFPTIFMLAQKKRYSFEGPRTMEGLENFVKQHLNPHLQHQLSQYRSLKN